MSFKKLNAALTYWKAQARDLPWRRTRDPYAILVSEMMLQQTQVRRVIPYFERWMKKFPTTKKLAAAPLQEVLKEWSGLGYNRRAKFLHDTAKKVVEKHSGKLPVTYEALRELPGIGDYTAKAIRVFAFNEPEVMIETNIRAVFLHHFFPRSKNVPDMRLGRYIALSLTRHDPRTFYAALMDYGTHLKEMHPNPSRRSKHHAKQSKFEGSLRQVRGAILRAIAEGKKLESVQREYGTRFEAAFQSLVRDGLITR